MCSDGVLFPTFLTTRCFIVTNVYFIKRTCLKPIYSLFKQDFFLVFFFVCVLMLVKKSVFICFVLFFHFSFRHHCYYCGCLHKAKERNTKTLAFVRNKDSIALLVQQPVEQSATLLPHYYGDCCGVVYIYGGAEQSQTFATLIIIFTFPSFLFIIISSFFFLSVFFCFFFLVQ